MVFLKHISRRVNFDELGKSSAHQAEQTENCQKVAFESKFTDLPRTVISEIITNTQFGVTCHIQLGRLSVLVQISCLAKNHQLTYFVWFSENNLHACMTQCFQSEPETLISTRRNPPNSIRGIPSTYVPVISAVKCFRLFI